jgi:hypothetical protein
VKSARFSARFERISIIVSGSDEALNRLTIPLSVALEQMGGLN